MRDGKKDSERAFFDKTLKSVFIEMVKKEGAAAGGRTAARAVRAAEALLSERRQRVYKAYYEVLDRHEGEAAVRGLLALDGYSQNWATMWINHYFFGPRALEDYAAGFHSISGGKISTGQFCAMCWLLKNRGIITRLKQAADKIPHEPPLIYDGYPPPPSLRAELDRVIAVKQTQSVGSGFF